MNRGVYSWMVGLLIAILCWACGNALQTSTLPDDSTLVFVDDYGQESTVPAYPQRIVSASPAITEIIYALGAEDRLVGRTDFCSYPPQCKTVESIGGISNLNVEKILSLRPDVVLCGSMIPQNSVQLCAQMGVPMVCVIEQPHFDSLYSNIAKIGRLVGCTARADSLNKVLRQRIAVVSQSIDTTLPRPSVYYVVGFGAGGNFTAGGNTFINDIIRMAGGRNVAENVTGWSYSLEALFDADPDYILIRGEDSAAFCSSKPYSSLRAVQQHHLVPLANGILDLQVPRNIDFVEQLYGAIHP